MSFFCSSRAHIDQQVAATDQVEFGKRRVFDHVLLGKDQHVADALVDAVGAAVRLRGEKARQPFRRDVGGNAGRVDAGAGLAMAWLSMSVANTCTLKLCFSSSMRSWSRMARE